VKTTKYDAAFIPVGLGLNNQGAEYRMPLVTVFANIPEFAANVTTTAVMTLKLSDLEDSPR
jgi:hypothetical protein